MAKFAGPIIKYPARAAFVWYLAVTMVGGLALSHPLCWESPQPVTPLEAAFTATSAACVTGLVVRSTGLDFTFWGQAIILLMIQIGGIGIMTITTFVTIGWRGQATLRQRAVVIQTLGGREAGDLTTILRNVVVFVLTFEAVGFAILFARLLLLEIPVGDACWEALFHAVSAFCNAGFALHDDSLMRYYNDPVVNFTVMGLIVSGGIGFPVMLDLWRNSYGPWNDRWDRLHLHTKLMLFGTAAMIVLGSVSFLALEWNNTLRNEAPATSLLMSLFQSVTARTAGFNTVDISGLTNATLFMLILLMMIGAGPCSTGGGVKVSTVMLLVLQSFFKFRGAGQVSVFRRTVPRELIDRATASVLLFTVVGALALTSMLVFEQFTPRTEIPRDQFLATAFEVISALGTVGLSMGITAELNPASWVILIVLMFVGRLGPISVVAALSRTEREAHLSYPKEEILVG